MIAKVLIEGLILGILLIGICAIGIRNGAVGMVHLYHHSGICCIYSCVCLWYKRCKRILVRILADVCHIVSDECDGSFSGG